MDMEEIEKGVRGWAVQGKFHDLFLYFPKHEEALEDFVEYFSGMIGFMREKEKLTVWAKEIVKEIMKEPICLHCKKEKADDYDGIWFRKGGSWYHLSCHKKMVEDYKYGGEVQSSSKDEAEVFIRMMYGKNPSFKKMVDEEDTISLEKMFTKVFEKKVIPKERFEEVIKTLNKYHD